MRIAVTSTVVFDVPEPDGHPVTEIRQRFYGAHVLYIGIPMETVTGQPYVLRAIERLEVERRDQ